MRKQKPSELLTELNPPLPSAPVHEKVNNSSIDRQLSRATNVLKSDHSVYIKKYLDKSFTTATWTVGISSSLRTMVIIALVTFDENRTHPYTKYIYTYIHPTFIIYTKSCVYFLLFLSISYLLLEFCDVFCQVNTRECIYSARTRDIERTAKSLLPVAKRSNKSTNNDKHWWYREEPIKTIEVSIE